MPLPYPKLPLSPWVTGNGPLMASPWCLFPSPSILQTASRMYFQIPNLIISILCFSVQFNHSVVSNSLRSHGLQQTRPPCPSPTPGACSNSCPLSWRCHPTISSSVVPFSSCLQSFPASRSFLMSQFFASDSQIIGVSASASVLLMNIQDWFPLGWTSLIFSLSKRLFRAFSNTTVQKHQFFGTRPSLWSNSYIHTSLLEKP